ncbi:MAG: class I SAM-dependent methyltransferase [Prevotella sp.]|nr:class I SAM-dependent methyltransferase [Prevotella sp.]
MPDQLILSPKQGYNLIAPYYDSWKWQYFWRSNEYPFIERWCNTLEPGWGADLGAGSGNNLGCFLQRKHRVTAYDISELMLFVCREKFREEIAQGLLECYVRDINELNITQRLYDWLLCNRVLSHICDVSNVIRRMARILRPGGQCFISDVHPMHRYDHTHYNIGGKEIVIETYKHNIQEMQNIAYINSFSILEFQEITSPKLLEPGLAANFHSIQDDETPIFYYMIMKKL